MQAAPAGSLANLDPCSEERCFQHRSWSLLVCPVVHTIWEWIEKGDMICISLLSSLERAPYSSKRNDCHLDYCLGEKSNGRDIRVVFTSLCGHSVGAVTKVSSVNHPQGRG